MDNVQKHNTCISVPSSQTFRSYGYEFVTAFYRVCFNKSSVIYFQFKFFYLRRGVGLAQSV
jgi:hypothetical protein